MDQKKINGGVAGAAVTLNVEGQGVTFCLYRCNSWLENSSWF